MYQVQTPQELPVIDLPTEEEAVHVTLSEETVERGRMPIYPSDGSVKYKKIPCKVKGREAEIKALFESGLSKVEIARIIDCDESSIRRTLDDAVRARNNELTKQRKKEQSVPTQKSLSFQGNRRKDPTFNDAYIRESSQSRCKYSGRYVDLDDSQAWEPDHIISKKNGGQGTKENHAVACTMANQSKGEYWLKDWLDLNHDITMHNDLVTNDEAINLVLNRNLLTDEMCLAHLSKSTNHIVVIGERKPLLEVISAFFKNLF